MSTEDKIKLFVMSQQMLESDLDKIEACHDFDLGRDHNEPNDKEEDFYPQFDQSIRIEAADMALHYELFYCLEISIRSIIHETLAEKHGSNWWELAITEQIKDEVKKNMQRELDSAVTPRSDKEIDYTTFGQLGDIVRKNWESFGDLFNSQKGFNKVMSNLNALRGPIAHCSPLADDEKVRLKITVRDWFRLMA